MHTDRKVFFLSASRSSDGLGWTRACRHEHSSIDDADRCAEKRNATIIVCDPLEVKAPAIVPAPYLAVRRERARIVRAAEQILTAGGDGPKVFTLPRDGHRAVRCRGSIIGTASSYGPTSCDRWTDITIIKTDSTRYVAHVVGRTTLPGEVDRNSVTIAENAGEIVNALMHPQQHYLSIVARTALEAAAAHDPAFAEALIEDV